MSTAEIIPDGLAPSLFIDVAQVRGGQRIVVAGEVDVATAPDLRDALVLAAGAGGDIELDLFGVTFMDSQGLTAMIVGRQAASADQAFTIVDCSPAVARLLDITSLGESFGIGPR